jgi:MFS family permease
LQLIYKEIYNWDDDELTFYTSMITSVYNLAAMVGALSSAAFMKYGKWNMIMACNICILIGYCFTVYSSIWALFVGRIMIGLAIGGYNVFIPKFINEIAPIEYRGPIGVSS